MQFALPTFQDTDCRFFSVCTMGAEAAEDDAAVRDALHALGSDTMLAAYNSGAGRANLSLTAYPDDTRPHFHVDVALTRSRRRKSTHTKEQVFAALTSLAFAEWSFFPFAGFVAKRSRAADFYSALGTRLDFASKAEIEMTGVELSFYKTPVSRLSVRLTRDEAFVEIWGRREPGPIKTSQLVELFNRLETFYNAFSRGDSP